MTPREYFAEVDRLWMLLSPGWKMLALVTMVSMSSVSLVLMYWLATLVARS